jgi:uncharacterized protein (DUF433 family)
VKVSRLSEFLRIVRDPEICGGQPTIKGTRVLVIDILELIKIGQTFDEILEGFPSINREDIQEIISYAEALINGEIIIYATNSDPVSA